MVVDDALGAARGARSVVERYAFPLVLWHDPLEIRIAGFQEILVVHLVAEVRHTGDVIGHFDHERGGAFHAVNGFHADRNELAVAEDDLCLAMVEDVGDGIDV